MGALDTGINETETEKSDISSYISGICSKLGLDDPMLIEAKDALSPMLALIVASIPLVLTILDKVAPGVIKREDLESGKLTEIIKVSGKNPDEYDSHKDFIKAANEDFEKDPKKQALVKERMNNLKDVEKNIDKAAGVALAGKVIGEETGIGYMNLSFWVIMNKYGFGADKAMDFIKAVVDEGMTVQDVEDYFNGRLPAEKNKRVGAGIKNVLKQLDALETDKQQTDAVNNMRDIFDEIKNE